MISKIQPNANAVFFDGWKPQRRNYQGADQAVKRYLLHLGLKKLPKGTQRHHINWNRSDGRPENILIAKNQKQHDSWHRQMIKFIIDCFNSNILKFDLKSLRYFVDDKRLAYKLKQVQ